MLTESHYRYMVNEAQECLDWLKTGTSAGTEGVDDLEKIVERANAALSDLLAAHEVLKTLRTRGGEG